MKVDDENEKRNRGAKTALCGAERHSAPNPRSQQVLYKILLPSVLTVCNNYYRSSSRQKSLLRTSQCIEIFLLSTTGYELFPLSMASPFAAPYFFRQPIRYLRWASHEKPAIFYSCCIAMLGPISMVAVPPVRRYFGDGPREKIPMTYPSKPLRTRLLGECGCRTVKGDSCIIEWGT